jgi:nitrate reductase delta subunit
MLGSARKSPGQFKSLERVAAWTRARFNLAPDAAVLVSEVTCSLPGCPPLETVIAFWSAGNTRHSFKLFKPVAQVSEDVLPPRWMKNAVRALENFVPECC